MENRVRGVMEEDWLSEDFAAFDTSSFGESQSFPCFGYTNKHFNPRGSRKHTISTASLFRLNTIFKGHVRVSGVIVDSGMIMDKRKCVFGLVSRVVKYLHLWLASCCQHLRCVLADVSSYENSSLFENFITDHCCVYCLRSASPCLSVATHLRGGVRERESAKLLPHKLLCRDVRNIVFIMQKDIYAYL